MIRQTSDFIADKNSLSHVMHWSDLFFEFPSKSITSIQRKVEILIDDNDTEYDRHGVVHWYLNGKKEKEISKKKTETDIDEYEQKTITHSRNNASSRNRNKHKIMDFMEDAQTDIFLTDPSLGALTKRGICRVNSIRYVQSGDLSSLTISNFRQEKECYDKKTVNKIAIRSNIVLRVVWSLIYYDLTGTVCCHSLLQIGKSARQ